MFINGPYFLNFGAFNSDVNHGWLLELYLVSKLLAGDWEWNCEVQEEDDGQVDELVQQHLWNAIELVIVIFSIVSVEKTVAHKDCTKDEKEYVSLEGPSNELQPKLLYPC